MSMFWNPGTGTYQRCCPALSPVKSQPPKSGVKSQLLKVDVKRQPLMLKKQPKQPESKQPPKSGVSSPIQPRNVASEQLQLQSASKRHPLKVVQPQVRPRAQPHVAQPPNTVQPQMPDLPPDPDPSKCKKVRMPITTGYTSYPQWGKAAPSLRIYKFYNWNETKVKG